MPSLTPRTPPALPPRTQGRLGSEPALQDPQGQTCRAVSPSQGQASGLQPHWGSGSLLSSPSSLARTPLSHRGTHLSYRMPCVSQGVSQCCLAQAFGEDPPGLVRESREALTILPNCSGGHGSKASLGPEEGG